MFDKLKSLFGGTIYKILSDKTELKIMISADKDNGNVCIRFDKPVLELLFKPDKCDNFISILSTASYKIKCLQKEDTVCHEISQKYH